jgi:predicted enzyme related to lactoylglutathione lyase
MITAVHALIYSDDPVATRSFLRDVLEWPFVEDAGTEAGWLIFRSGRSEVGVHPTHAEFEGQVFDQPRQHVLSLMCDDLESTQAELRDKGATFCSPVADRGWGLTVMMDIPGADPMVLYQPKHPTAYDL